MDVDWREYFQAIVSLPPSFRIAVGKPTDSELDLFEKHSGFRLPLAYRSFVKLLGPGELAFDFRIRVPTQRVENKDCLADSRLAQVNLQCFNLDLRTDGPLRPEVIDDYADSEKRIGRLVYFADNSAGDLVGWDPLELIDSSRIEYATYLVLGEEMSIRFLANSFYDFVDTTCFAGRTKLSADPTQNRKEHYVFQPASFPPK